MIATILNRNISTVHQRSFYRSTAKSAATRKCQSCQVKHRCLSSKSGKNQVVHHAQQLERTKRYPSSGTQKTGIEKVATTLKHRKEIASNHTSSVNIQPYLVAFATGSMIAYSIYTRKWRERQLGTLPLAQDCGIFYSHGEEGGAQVDHFDCLGSVKRNIDVLALTIERTGLMVNRKPGAKSVKVRQIVLSKSKPLY